MLIKVQGGSHCRLPESIIHANFEAMSEHHCSHAVMPKSFMAFTSLGLKTYTKTGKPPARGVFCFVPSPRLRLLLGGFERGRLPRQLGGRRLKVWGVHFGEEVWRARH